MRPAEYVTRKYKLYIYNFTKFRQVF